VILINLLPHREARRRQRKQAFFVALGISAGIGLMLSALWYAAASRMVSTQQARNAFLSSEIKILESQIKDIATLNADIEALKARQKAVEDLQIDRNTPVRLLAELVRQAPDGVYLNSIRQSGDRVAMTGLAQTNERVSEFLRNISYGSPWLHQPELGEIKLSAGGGGSRDGGRLYEFSIRATLKRSPVADAAPPGRGG
jgi:type IV pilus assembly protein PilN